MKHRIVHLLIITLSLVFVSMDVCAEETTKSMFSLAPMLQKVTPAVVKITTAKEDVLNPFDSNPKPRKEELGLGSGVIYDAAQGLIVTNAHVVTKSKIIVVTLKNGRRYIAKLIGEDDGFDIAVIKITAKDLSSIHFGDSDQLQVGDFVAAIGSPFGLTETVTSGVVSALNRSEPKIEGYQSFIQTDTPINPGNSGGALVDMKGDLVGINTALVSPAFGNVGIGFAIPSNMVKNVVEQLVKYGKMERGILGVIAQDITPALARAMELEKDLGAVVTTIIPNSPADTAGVKVADIILALNKKSIHNAEQLRDSLGTMRPGTSIELSISRQGKPMTVGATVGDPQKIAKQREVPFISGLSLQDFNELESDDHFLKGVLVTGISEVCPAALAGLMPGDIITVANQQPIQTVTELETIAKKHPKHLLLQVTRNNTGLFVVIENNEENQAG